MFLITTFIAILMIPASFLLQEEKNRMIIIAGSIGFFMLVIIIDLITHWRNTTKLFEFETPQKNLPGKATDTINILMGDLKAAIASDFKELYPKSGKIKFRANIFMFHEVVGGSVYLRVHESFRRDMMGEIDEDLALMPGIGSTGHCFSTHKRRISIKHEKWDDREGVNNILSKKIHPDLKWLLTYPILDRRKKILAVLNIDCLHFNITEKILDTLEPQLNLIQAAHQDIVDKIAGIIAKFPRDQITITKKKIIM
jgi:hypothetical protein